MRQPHVLVFLNVSMSKHEPGTNEIEDVLVRQGHAPQRLQRTSSKAANLSKRLQHQDWLTTSTRLGLRIL